jgi:hypothetical protein
MKKGGEYQTFNQAMDKILKADPAKVKAAMDEEKRERAAERTAKKTEAQK